MSDRAILRPGVLHSRGLHSAVLILAALTPSIALGVDSVEGPSRLGAFAFADSSGMRIIALTRIIEPESVRVLLAAEGRQFPVRYVRDQEPTDLGSGREMAYNFEHCEGQIFRLEGARIWPDETCFLAGDSLMAMGATLHLTPRHESRDIRGDQIGENDSFVDSKHRGLRASWFIAEIPDRGWVDLYEFVPQGRDYLASIALWLDSRLVAGYDLPAKLSDADPSSLWRIGDGGQLCSECFEVLFVIEGPGQHYMATSWEAEEGESLKLLRSEGAEFKLALSGYRYWYPR